jgi:hypothetical protein
MHASPDMRGGNLEDQQSSSWLLLGRSLVRCVLRILRIACELARAASPAGQRIVDVTAATVRGSTNDRAAALIKPAGIT